MPDLELAKETFRQSPKVMRGKPRTNGWIQNLIFPAWPKDWECAFKLHAPGRTTIQGEWKHGKLIDLAITPEERRKDVVSHLTVPGEH